jgi:hypothetical protein
VRIYIVEGKDEFLFLKIALENKEFEVVDFQKRDKKIARGAEDTILRRYKKLVKIKRKEFVKIEGGIEKVEKIFFRRYIEEGQISHLEYFIDVFVFCDDENGRITKLIEEMKKKGKIDIIKEKKIDESFKFFKLSAYERNVYLFLSLPNLDEIVRKSTGKKLKDIGDEKEKENILKEVLSRYKKEIGDLEIFQRKN